MRKKKITKEDYVELFCQEKRIRERRVIYVSEEVHSNLKDLAFLFRFEEFTTTSSLADAILKHHMETYKDLINELHRERREKILKTIDEYEDDESDLS